MHPNWWFRCTIHLKKHRTKRSTFAPIISNVPFENSFPPSGFATPSQEKKKIYIYIEPQLALKKDIHPPKTNSSHLNIGLSNRKVVPSNSPLLGGKLTALSLRSLEGNNLGPRPQAPWKKPRATHGKHPSSRRHSKVERLSTSPLPPGAQPVGAIPGIVSADRATNGTVPHGPVSNPLTLRHEPWSYINFEGCWI